MLAMGAALTMPVGAQGRISAPLRIGNMTSGTVTFGIKADMNLSNYWDGELHHGIRNGGRIGVFAEFQPSGERWAKWSLQPELYFSSEGGKTTINQSLAENTGAIADLQAFASAAIGSKAVFTTNYLAMPIMVRYKVLPQLSVEAGPQLSLNVYSRVHIDGKEDTDVNLKDHTHLFNIGVGAGVTYKVTDYIMVNARYNMDFIHTFKNLGDKNSNIAIGIAYKL